MSSAIAHSEPENGFEDFDLSDPLLDALDDLGFHTPRPIQAETIPAALDGRDVMGLAQTGTGKTAAFALPILERLLDVKRNATRVLVLAPTRELANQIAEEVRDLAQHTRISATTVYGGVSMNLQLRALRKKPDIVVGCPGRVLDLLQQNVFDVSKVDTLVLDEADHMFDMGFLRDVEKILSRLPRRRQNLLFSATMPKEIRSLANEILTKPHVVELATSAPAEQIEHYLYAVPEAAKKTLLNHVLSKAECETAIVFMRTKHRAKRTALRLAKEGRRAVALQGNMSQAQRDRAMAGFREGKYDVLVATDIAARGLDIAGVDYVVNFDVPTTPEAYTHRIGRTGRSEETGKACTFVTDDDQAWLRATERILGSRIPVRKAPGIQAPEKATRKKASATRSSRKRRSRRRTRRAPTA